MISSGTVQTAVRVKVLKIRKGGLFGRPYVVLQPLEGDSPATLREGDTLVVNYALKLKAESANVR